ncbi:MAG: acyltransferase family protein [Planctomycetes bacterium]|nr:acyltransferase family protein [Planctomycetota bacterium]
MHTTPGHQRLHSLDALRAWMMLLGIVLHGVLTYGTIDYGEAWPLKDRNTNIVWDLTVFTIHVFRMPVFFVLAGFFTALLVERRGLLAMLRNRALRIGVPFVVFLLVLFPLIAAGYSYALVRIQWHGTHEAALRAAWNAIASVDTWQSVRTMHLWFLYYLLHFYVTVAVLRAVIPIALRDRIRDLFGALLSSRARMLVPAGATMITLIPMRSGGLDTDPDFVIWPRTYIAYLVFFGFGYLLHAHRDRLSEFGRGAWRSTLLGLTFLVVSGAAAEAAADGTAGARALRIVAGGLATWSLVFGSIGLSLRYGGHANPRTRYVVDASYWIYLVHLPLCFWLPGLFANFDVSAIAKAPLVIAVMTPILFVSYHILVRSTWIGTMLNGRRYPLRLRSQ